jgi:diaminohydroxyphosphoribosylaminopyrimidine deaminase/5-amino-6-(5-phosphoribosylamino)uracil reductase
MATGYTAPNPVVGAVLVHEGRIIGEGYHEYYGKAHAEVNCIQSVRQEDQGKLFQSTLYVSLEPCAHFGRTPPCADLIISKKISRVVIGCRDPNELVDGRGIEKLLSAGVQVELGILQKECIEINKRFFTYIQKRRPFILLKWAQTFDGFIGKVNSRQFISNDLSNRLTHKWRSEEAGILIGTNTALLDDPALTVRLWTGHQPVRILIDLNLRLPSTLKMFGSPGKIIIFNTKEERSDEQVEYIKLDPSISVVPQLIRVLHRMEIQSIMVEGGAKLLQTFIQEGVWDEARIVTNKNMILGDGIKAPAIKHARLVREETMDTDLIHYFLPA